jgi:hypothetical protein
MANKKRHASPERVTKLWSQLKSVTKVARRIGYSWVGTARFLNRLGLIKSKA